MEIEIIKLNNSMPIPSFQTKGAAAIDLHSANHVDIKSNTVGMVFTGVMLHIKDPNVCGIVAPRSGIATKYKVSLANTIGVIDSDYQGEIILHLENKGCNLLEIERGQRIAQMMFIPILKPEFKEVLEFSENTARGSGGFGHTGVK